MYYKLKKHYKTEKYLHTINNNVLQMHITLRHLMCLKLNAGKSLKKI